MASRYQYTHSTGSNVDVSSRVRAYRTEATMNAEEGSVALSTFIVDDEDAGLDIKGHRTFQWIESSESSNSNVIWYGYTADRDVQRGPFRVQWSREWNVNAADVNSYLTRPIMRGSDANRPAETDVARVQWLMTTSEMSGVPDTTYLSTSGAVAMDANDYRDQTILSILDDCAQQSGKNYFVFYNGFTTPPKLGLFYDFADSSAYASSVRLTNVLADADSTTTYLVFNDDLKLNRDPSRVYSDVLLPYTGGEVYIRRASIGNEFAFRATTAPAVNVHTNAKATARANRYLDDIAAEEDRLTMSYLVPLARVNQLMQGHRFSVKFSHLPGYTDWTWVRALKRTVLAISEEFYKVTIEATPALGHTGTCTLSVNTAEQTASVDLGHTFGPVSIPVSAASFANAQQIVVMGYTGAFPNGTMAVGGGWTQLDTYNPVSNTQLAAGRLYQAAIATPPNMTVASTSSGGGAPGAYAAGIAFPTSSSAPVQQTPAVVTVGSATLPSTPTPGNILVVWAVGETDALDPTTFQADGGVMVIDNAHFEPGNVGGVYISFGIRCVRSSDTKTIRIPGNSHSHWAGVSEWAP